MFGKIALKFVAVIAITLTSVMFFGCFKSQEETVSEIAMDFTKNVFAGNADAVKPYSTEAAAEAAVAMKDLVSMNPQNKNVIVSVESVTVNKDAAIVKVIVQRPSEKDAIMTVPMVKQDDKWLVDWTKINGGLKNRE